MVAVGGVAWLTSGGGVTAAESALPVPVAKCGPGSLPEATQGRVPKADYASGRAAKGYRCNTQQVSHQGASGGFKTWRYTDAAGHTCAFYDSTLVIGRDIVANLINGAGQGVVVLDMTDPAKPVKTANLVSASMLTPHESLMLHPGRGLLMAEMGTLATLPGVLAIYDVKTDCRHPKLLSQSLGGLLGHESGIAPDGKTFYISGTAEGFYAVDISDPRRPKRIFSQSNVRYHGMRVSDDGKTLYAAFIGDPGPGGIGGAGMRVVDVSQIQARTPSPKAPVLSTLTWNGSSIPQVNEPFTRNGHKYLLEVDEFNDLFTPVGLLDPKASPVGAARIINVDDPRRPKVVSDIRLRVHQAEERVGDAWNDPGASTPAQGYAAHYCSLPRRDNPNLAGCSMILSGLRIFDIRDVAHPKEVAYFNKPVTSSTEVAIPPKVGAYAMSAPTWDPARKSVWYTDANSGFYAVRLTNGVGDLLK